jgi:hypothetical protein
MVRWQYRVVATSAGFVDQLGRLGEDGWELITVDGGSALFKRPVEDGETPDGPWAESVPAPAPTFAAVAPPPAPVPMAPPPPPTYAAPAPTYMPPAPPPPMSRMERLLRERGIDAPGAAGPLEHFAGNANVDALCAARAAGRDGVFIVVGNRVGVWDAESASVHPFDLRAFPTVTAVGRELTLRAAQGFDVTLTITNESAAAQWIALLGKFGVRPG